MVGPFSCRSALPANSPPARVQLPPFAFILRLRRLCTETPYNARAGTSLRRVGIAIGIGIDCCCGIPRFFSDPLDSGAETYFVALYPDTDSDRDPDQSAVQR